MKASESKIAVVGHCRGDAFALRSSLSSMLPGADIVIVESDKTLASELPGLDLCLVNRALDGRFTAPDGVELIRQIHATGNTRPATMLVSGYADAQARAVEAGARPGFSKRDLYSDEMRDSLCGVLDCSQDRDSA